jgi:polar amino acid transport system substrate-binding protein
MKRIIALTAVLALMLALFAACGGTVDKKEEDGTATAGELKIGMEIGYPPMEYVDADGVTPIGFDVDVAYELGRRLNREVELVDTAWDAIFTSLDSNRYDAIISSVSITPERQEKYIITEAYIANKLVLITAADSQVTKPEELAGLRVATQTETTADIMMNELIDGGLALGDYFVYDKIIQCFDELKLGRVDAVMVDSVVAAYYLGEDSARYKTAWENDEGEPLGIALKKGNDDLAAQIETALDEMYADGTMKTLAEKHFGRDVTEGVR